MEGVDDIVARAWPGRKADVAVLGGGLVNEKALVTLDGVERFVLHCGGPGTRDLAVDRRVEVQASLAAAAVGVGPPVETFLEEDGCLVTRYIDGHPVGAERLRDPTTLARVAVAIRAFHKGPPLPRRFSSFEIVETYRTTAFARGADVPATYAWARQIARRIQAVRGPAPERPCHNDLLDVNLIDDGTRIRIVDWQYAGMGDVLFDLANLAVNHDFGDAEHETLLAAYFGKATEEHLRALHLMRFMSDFREAMWGVARSAAPAAEVDFAAYAAERFSRLERTAASPAFQAALGTS